VALTSTVSGNSSGGGLNGFSPNAVTPSP
jgi:hypothetical protein